MCNYKYPGRERKKCQYPKFYNEHFNEFNLAEELPVDDEGLCIFHSKNNNWKLENNFFKYFKSLIKLQKKLNRKLEDKNKAQFDFAGFQFPDDKQFLFAEITEPARWNFKGAHIPGGLKFKNALLLDLAIDNATFGESCVLENVELKSTLTAVNTTFRHLYIKNALFRHHVQFSKAIFGTDESNRSLTITNTVLNKEFGFLHDAFFTDCNFDGFVAFKNINTAGRFALQNCIFHQSVLISQININDSFEMEACRSTLPFDTSGYYSTIDFSGIKLADGAVLSIKGTAPMDDVVAGDIHLGLNPDYKGVVRVENFNLNKLVNKDRVKLLELSRLGKAEIGKGCRKYVCQTELFTIKTSDSSQDLILDLVKVFCNYFKHDIGINLGIEIVSRTPEQISYFYFTDEDISQDEFLSRISQNEESFWNTLATLTESAQKAIGNENLGLIDCLIDLGTWWKKLGLRISGNQIDARGLSKVVNSISLEGRAEQYFINTFQAIQERFNKAIGQPEFVLNMNMHNIINIKGDRNIAIQDAKGSNIDINKS